MGARVECEEHRKLVVRTINAALGGEKKKCGLRNVLVGLKYFVRGETTKHHHGYCPPCFAHALIRVYDALLDWKLVDGRVASKLDFNAPIVPVFSALFAEIGKSEIPRENIRGRVEELCAKQGKPNGDSGIIVHYREQARNAYERILGERSVRTLSMVERKSILKDVMKQVDLPPAGFRFRNCEPECEKCRGRIDDAVDWLERDENLGRPVSYMPPSWLEREENLGRHVSYKSDPEFHSIKMGVEGYVLRVRDGEEIPKEKWRHITDCKRCFIYLITKTRGTKWAGEALAGDHFAFFQAGWERAAAFPGDPREVQAYLARLGKQKRSVSQVLPM
jgi:hypothetical protein